MIKKAIAAAFAALAFTLSACGQSAGVSSTSGQAPTSAGSSSDSGVTPENTAAVARSAEELVELLRKSPYKSDIAIEGDFIGGDFSSVGADEAAFDNTAYPAFADDECVAVFAAEDYDIREGAQDNSSKLNRILSEAREIEGKKKIRFKKGRYEFSSTIKVYNADDLCIDGGGSDFVMTEWLTAFDVYNCKRVRFNDIYLDYSPSPTISGKVVSCDESSKTVTVRPESEFDLADPVYDGGRFTYGSYEEYRFDKYTGAYVPDPDGNLLYNESITAKSYNAEKNLLTLSFSSMKKVAAGTRVAVAFTMYSNCGVYVNECNGVYFENIDVYTCPGMAFTCVSNRNLYFNRSDVRLKKGSLRLMSATADGIHCKDTAGEIKITGCLLEQSHDDSINICNFYKTVASVDGNVLNLKGRQGYDFPLERGNTVDVFRPETYGYVATLKVSSVTKNGLDYTVTVTGDTSGVKEGCLVGNVSRSPRVTIENNVFRNKRNRGILCQFRNSKIVNNAFINIVHGAIVAHSTADVFKEAIVPKDVEIKNNKFISNEGFADDIWISVTGESNEAEAGTATRISVENNLFYGSSRYCVYMRGAGQIPIKNNLFADFCLKTGKISPVYATASEDVELSGNALLTGYGEASEITFDDCAGITASGNRIFIKSEAISR